MTGIDVSWPKPEGLTDFLLARIAEDEAVAREATPAPWHLDNEDVPEAILDVEDEPVVGVNLTEPWSSAFITSDALHLVRWHPGRVLAECEAKRLIVAHHAFVPDIYPNLPGSCAICSGTGRDAQGHPCLTLRALAHPYADHPEYQAEWRP